MESVIDVSTETLISSKIFNYPVDEVVTPLKSELPRYQFFVPENRTKPDKNEPLFSIFVLYDPNSPEYKKAIDLLIGICNQKDLDESGKHADIRILIPEELDNHRKIRSSMRKDIVKISITPSKIESDDRWPSKSNWLETNKALNILCKELGVNKSDVANLDSPLQISFGYSDDEHIAQSFWGQLSHISMDKEQKKLIVEALKYQSIVPQGNFDDYQPDMSAWGR